MPRDPSNEEAPTRRKYVKYGGVVVGGGLFAGCVGGDGGEPTPTDTGTEPPTDDEPTTTQGDTYTATLAPAGDVEFDEVPTDVFTILSHHAGMALALGRGDAINALHAPGYFQSLHEKFLHRLDGVSVDWTGLYSSWPPSKEKLFELDSDVHLADPAKVDAAEGWSREDVAEVAETVGPWFGNTFSAAHGTPPDAWAGDYEYYTLWEIFERVAAVFQERRRYEALAAVRDSLLATIGGSLPPERERPSTAMVLFSTQDDSLWAYRINQPGYYAAHTRPLGATDALVEAFGTDYALNDNGKIDYETLLEANPDVLLVLGPMSEFHDIAEIRATLADHEVASEVDAVQNDRVYTQGLRRQGPLVNLFQLEMAAKQLYPDPFGEWPGYTDGDPYPEIPADERLFDRQRVADIVAGEFSTPDD